MHHQKHRFILHSRHKSAVSFTTTGKVTASCTCRASFYAETPLTNTILSNHYNFSLFWDPRRPSVSVVTPLMDHRNTFPLMFGSLVMQATQLPCKIMEGTRLRFVHCAAKAHHKNVMKMVVLRGRGPWPPGGCRSPSARPDTTGNRLGGHRTAGGQDHSRTGGAQACSGHTSRHGHGGLY